MIAMPSNEVSKIADIVRERRHELRLTQEQLAKAAGIPKGTIGSIEAGNVKGVPTFGTLLSLEQGLRLDPGTLVTIAYGGKQVPVGTIPLRALPSLIKEMFQLDEPAPPEPPKGIPQEKFDEVVEATLRLSDEDRAKVLEYAQMLLKKYEGK